MSSPNCTSVPTVAQITDTAGVGWTLGATADAAGNRDVLRNGVQTGGRASEVFFADGVVYVRGNDANWWKWANSAFTKVGATRPACVVATTSTETPATTQPFSVITLPVIGPVIAQVGVAVAGFPVVGPLVVSVANAAGCHPGTVVVVAGVAAYFILPSLLRGGRR